jgi:hypothetical protein
MGPCIVRYRGGIYDQQDATNSQNLFLEILYMFRASSPPLAVAASKLNTYQMLCVQF